MNQNVTWRVRKGDNRRELLHVQVKITPLLFFAPLIDLKDFAKNVPLVRGLGLRRFRNSICNFICVTYGDLK